MELERPTTSALVGFATHTGTREDAVQKSPGVTTFWVDWYTDAKDYAVEWCRYLSVSRSEASLLN